MLQTTDLKRLVNVSKLHEAVFQKQPSLLYSFGTDDESKIWPLNASIDQSKYFREQWNKSVEISTGITVKQSCRK